MRSSTETETVENVDAVNVDEPTSEAARAYRVILYNDDWHSQDEVVLQLQKATGCDLDSAIRIMIQAHRTGRAICYRGTRDDCQRVAGILRQIRLQVEVDCD